MSDTPYFVQLDEAITIACRTKIKTELETVDLDQSHGRILAEDLSSLVDDPAFDNSAMDGFAMRYEDTKNPPQTLDIIGTIQAAGQEENVIVGPKQAVRIMTGAPIPKGADSILQVELTTTSESKVTLQQEGMKHFIRKQGENLLKGSISITAGKILTPSRIGLCATMGHSTLPVIKPLKVAIISTGDELIPPGEELQR